MHHQKQGNVKKKQTPKKSTIGEKEYDVVSKGISFLKKRLFKSFVTKPSLHKWIRDWREVKKLTFSLKSGHFFLEGRYLDDFSKEVISNARKEVLVVNPFVEMCSLSDTMWVASKNNIEVRLVTRKPKKDRKRREEEKYLRKLEKEGIAITYTEKVHAKIIVVDRAIAIISSMNFISSSSAGASWEAGLVTIDETVIRSMIKSIFNLLSKPLS